MAEEKWIKIYNRSMSYDINLERLLREFLRIWGENKQSPQINFETEYTPVTILGSGAFGVVKLCRNKKTDQYYAVKVLNKENLYKSRQIDHVKSEKRILAAVCFPFLVYLVFSGKDNSFLYLCLPFINGGELFTYHQKSRRFSERLSKFYSAQIFLAIEYLHYLNILYRDLKTENILIDYKGYLKLSDFGFCKRIEGGRTWTLCGTPEYLAPEIIKARPYGKTVDWWSFGILCYEFVSGYTPFRSNDVLVMYERICTANYKFPAFFSKELKGLINHLLELDVTKRYGTLKNGTKDIRDTEWFKDINWKAILAREIEPLYVPKLANEIDISNFNHYPCERSSMVGEYDKYADLFNDF